MSLLDRIQRCTFIGPEFLTWLWYRCEKQDGIFDLGLAGGPFEIWFDDRLTVGSNLVDAQENLFKGGHPTSSLEARSALRLGKQATEARLRMVRGAQEWTFTFKAIDLSISGLKLPTVLSKEDDDRFYERMYLLEQLEAIIKGLFVAFIRLRVNPNWGRNELKYIQEWVGQSEATATPIMALPPLVEEGHQAADEDMEVEATVDDPPPANPETPPWEDPILGNEK